MDFVSYRGLPMTIIQSLAWEREPILDDSNTTYLYTRWRGSIIVTYNPGAVSYVTAPGLGVPVPAAGAMPPVTDVAIRAFLEEPRGQLVVMSLGVPVIISPPTATGPLPGFPGGITPGIPGFAGFTQTLPSDARNGPILKVNSIVQIPGERLWKIHLDIETYVNASPNVGTAGVPPVMVSNRWSVRSDTNWQHLTTIIHQGVCTVRADTLNAAPPFLSPLLVGIGPFVDAFRTAFASFNVPLNFQRTKVLVHITPDGNSAHYTVEDTEKIMNMPGLGLSGITRVEAQDTNWVWQGSFGRAALQHVGNLTNINPAGIFVPYMGPINVGMQMMQSLGTSIARNMPKYYRNVVARVWGNRSADRRRCVDLALGIASNRMGTPAVFNTTTSEIIVTADTNNLATVSWTTSWDFGTVINGMPVGAALAIIDGIFPGAVGGPVAPGLGASSWINSIKADPTTPLPGAAPGIPSFGTVLTPGTPGLVNNPVMNASGTRGTYLGVLLTQVLESFATSPGPPVATP